MAWNGADIAQGVHSSRLAHKPHPSSPDGVIFFRAPVVCPCARTEARGGERKSWKKYRRSQPYKRLLCLFVYHRARVWNAFIRRIELCAIDRRIDLQNSLQNRARLIVALPHGVPPRREATLWRGASPLVRQSFVVIEHPRYRAPPPTICGQLPFPVKDIHQTYHALPGRTRRTSDATLLKQAVVQDKRMLSSRPDVTQARRTHLHKRRKHAA